MHRNFHSCTDYVRFPIHHLCFSTRDTAGYSASEFRSIASGAKLEQMEDENARFHLLRRSVFCSCGLLSAFKGGVAYVTLLQRLACSAAIYDTFRLSALILHLELPAWDHVCWRDLGLQDDVCSRFSVARVLRE